MSADTDQIVRRLLIEAPRARVWQALTDPQQFGAWFGVDFQGASFAPGRHVTARITIPGYQHVTFAVDIERMEPQRRLSWRWHPAAIERGVDYSAEPTTLVEFELEDAPGGTLLMLVESGFDRVPVERRLHAFRLNSAGWDQQLQNIARHVTTQ